ncbi:hypothetical protein ACNKHR_04015 [Shigella flexneri]
MATSFPVTETLVSVVAQLLPFAPPRRRLFSAPTSGDVVLAAQSSEMSLIDFAFKTTPPSQLLQLSAWTSPTSSASYLDKKEHISHEMLICQ